MTEEEATITQALAEGDQELALCDSIIDSLVAAHQKFERHAPAMSRTERLGHMCHVMGQSCTWDKAALTDLLAVAVDRLANARG